MPLAKRNLKNAVVLYFINFFDDNERRLLLSLISAKFASAVQNLTPITEVLIQTSPLYRNGVQIDAVGMVITVRSRHTNKIFAIRRIDEFLSTIPATSRIADAETTIGLTIAPLPFSISWLNGQNVEKIGLILKAAFPSKRVKLYIKSGEFSGFGYIFQLVNSIATKLESVSCRTCDVRWLDGCKLESLFLHTNRVLGTEPAYLSSILEIEAKQLHLEKCASLYMFDNGRLPTQLETTNLDCSIDLDIQESSELYLNVFEAIRRTLPNLERLSLRGKTEYFDVVIEDDEEYMDYIEDESGTEDDNDQLPEPCQKIIHRIAWHVSEVIKYSPVKTELFIDLDVVPSCRPKECAILFVSLIPEFESTSIESDDEEKSPDFYMESELLKTFETERVILEFRVKSERRS